MARLLSFLWRGWAVVAGALFVAGCGTTLLAPDGAAEAAAQRTVVRPDGSGRDAYVLLSGGGTPLSNNYSQYLQARAVADYFGRELAGEATWVFFGVGNRDGAAPVLADVRRERLTDGAIVPSWEPGVLPRNRPATKAEFLRALRAEILPTVSGGGTLYLFVGDHGELTGKDEAQESAITLWQLKRGRRRDGSWTTDTKETLGVAELRAALAEGLGAGRVVFAMTQCHSGGFHELAVAKTMTPPRAWFTTVPDGLGRAGPGLRLRAGGFTATDMASLASGCDPDPDPERWAGYERFLPEAVLGRDLMSGAAKGAAAVSLAAAHEAATLFDRTIDQPRATSEHYLEAWATTIESRLANTLAVTPRVLAAVAAYQRAVDTGRVGAAATAADAALAARAAQFGRFTAQLAADVPAAAEVLRAGTRAQLEAALQERGGRGGGPRGGRRGAMAEARKTWNETLRPAWKAAVEAGAAGSVLPTAAAEFERELLKLEDGGRDFFLPRGGDVSALSNEIYWRSGYAEPATLDRAKAEAVARWGATRRAGIVAWARTAPEAAVRAAAEKIGPGASFSPEEPRPMTRRTAVERVLFYRRVLAAWEFLVALEHRDALAELRTLIALEATPLRRG